jgi:hypothetical protein
MMMIDLSKTGAAYALLYSISKHLVFEVFAEKA